MLAKKDRKINSMKREKGEKGKAGEKDKFEDQRKRRH
jgi:hypothetical protein